MPNVKRITSAICKYIFTQQTAGNILPDTLKCLYILNIAFVSTVVVDCNDAGYINSVECVETYAVIYKSHQPA